MKASAHLWAVGYDDELRAELVRKVISTLAVTQRSLRLLDSAVLVRLRNGSLLFNGQSFSPKNRDLSSLGFLAGFALAAPFLTEEVVARVFDSTVPEVADAIGIDDKFKSDIASMMRPGTSALLVLDVVEDIDGLLPHLRGLGGTILRTNVDLESLNLIRSTLQQTMNDETKKSDADARSVSGQSVINRAKVLEPVADPLP